MRGLISKQAGLTMIEVLIAMAITVVIGVIAFVAVDTAITAKESTSVQLDRLREMNGFYNRLSQDLRQTIIRPLRDENDQIKSAFLGGEAEVLLSITRSGWRNFTAAKRSRLQRVSYLWRDGDLWRQSWKVLDRTRDSNPVEYLIMADVEEIQVRFLEMSKPGTPGAQPSTEWVETWNSELVEDNVEPMPIAIELTLTVKQVGELKRIIEVMAYAL